MVCTPRPRILFVSLIMQMKTGFTRIKPRTIIYPCSSSSARSPAPLVSYVCSDLLILLQWLRENVCHKKKVKPAYINILLYFNGVKADFILIYRV